MATSETLVSMLTQPEGVFLERKPSSVNMREIRQTVVAFANSLSADEEAVLFIGVQDDGTVVGCQSPDATQKSVREACDHQCYPPVAHKIFVLHGAKNVVAVVVTADGNGPHFSGPAFVRRGSESVAASLEVFDELVHSRNSKTATFLKTKRSSQVVRIVGTEYGRGEGGALLVGSSQGIDCKVFDCNAHYVRLEVIANMRRITEPLENVAISYDDEKWCPKIIVTHR